MITLLATHRFLIFLVLIIITAHAFGKDNTLAQSPMDVSVDIIIDQWQKRHERFQTGDISWTMTCFIAQGATVADGIQSYGDQLGPIPPEDASIEGDAYLNFSGDQMRYSGMEYAWNSAIAEMLPIRELSVWNGDNAATLTQRDPRSRFTNEGRLENNPRSGIVSKANVMPLLIYYRPMHFERYLRGYTVTGREELLAENTYIILQQGSPSQGLRTIWIDPEADFAISRMTTELEGSILLQRDIKYSNESELGLIPVNWSVVENDSTGKMIRASNAVVSDTRLNIDIPPNRFELTFPPSTLVYDFREGTDYLTQFIVRRDGSVRPVERAELRRGATPDTLLKTKPGEAAAELTSATRGWSWLLIVNMLIVILVIAYLGIRLCGGTLRTSD